MTVERFHQIFEEADSKWTGDNAFAGLQIIAKYIDPKQNDIIKGAEHDVLYSVNVDKIIEAGITEEDAIALAQLNWSIDEGFDGLMCFV